MRVGRLIISSILGLSLVLSQTMASSAATQQFGLEEALRMAIAQDPELKLIEDKIALAEKELRQVNANADFLKTKTIYEKEEYVSNRKAYLLTPLKKENSVASLKRQEETKVNGLNLELMTQYYDVISKIDQLNDVKRSYATLEKEIKAKAQELSIGKITQLDYNSFELKRIEMENAVSKATVDLDISYMKFASISNQPLEYKFTPASISKDIKPFVLENQEIVLSNEKTKHNELLSKQASIKEMELEIKINTDSQYEMGNTDSATNVLQEDLKAAQKDLADIEQNILMTLKIDTYKLQSSYDSILVSKASLALAQKELEIAKVKYSVGNISLLDYLTKQEALDKAESNYNGTITAYLTAVEKFKMNHFIK